LTPAGSSCKSPQYRQRINRGMFPLLCSCMLDEPQYIIAQYGN